MEKAITPIENPQSGDVYVCNCGFTVLVLRHGGCDELACASFAHCGVAMKKVN